MKVIIKLLSIFLCLLFINNQPSLAANDSSGIPDFTSCSQSNIDVQDCIVTEIKEHLNSFDRESFIKSCDGLGDRINTCIREVIRAENNELPLFLKQQGKERDEIFKII